VHSTKIVNVDAKMMRSTLMRANIFS